MNPPKGEQTIFAEALRLPPQERAAYLAQSAIGNPELREEVESLLRSYAAGEFLEQAAAPEIRSTAPVPVTERPGDTIGRYKLLQQIGEGGCGVVYMAEQEEPFHRRVALKIIKLGMDTRSVIARFEAERQALAMMDHPNIARVLDAGVTGISLAPSRGEGRGEGVSAGRPYFVMELVRGMKITDYCDEKKLPTRQRLDLFIQVCQAIQHAHQKGIIHRDIKPSNILVTINDGVPVPKVIDFGIAKATGGLRLTDRTLFTAFEQFIGTPAYMSPEQAVLTSLDIDTRSDIYALGVLLYELLTGKTPFDARELLAIGLDEMRRTIREQEPPRPSTRVSTLPGQELSTTAQGRGLDAPKLVTELRGDLDWIVMKALEKDRARRYETANGLAADVQRHLNNEPVVACPPSRIYRLRKTVQRNKLACAAAACVAGALLIGFGASTWMFVREREAKGKQISLRRQAEANDKKARTEAAKSQHVANFLKQMLEGVGPSVALGRDTLMLREILDRTALHVSKNLNEQPDVEIELLLILSTIYAELGRYTEARGMAQRALDVARSLGEGNDYIADALDAIAAAERFIGNHLRAETLAREGLALRQMLHGTGHLKVAQSLHHLGLALLPQTKQEATLRFRECLDIRRKWLGENSLEVADTAANLAQALSYHFRLDEAESLIRSALATQERLLPVDHPQLARTIAILGDILSRGRRLQEGEAEYRRAIEKARKSLHPQHPSFAGYFYHLGRTVEAQGKMKEAECLYRNAIAIETTASAGSFYLYRHVRSGPIEALASLLVKEKKVDEAEKLFADLLHVVGEARAAKVAILRARGIFNAHRQRFPEAAADLIKVCDLDPTVENFHDAAPVLAQSGNIAAYQELCRNEIARFGNSTYPNDAERVAKDCLILPNAGVDLEVVAKLAAIAVSCQAEHPDMGWFRFTKALAEYRLGHFESAVQWLGQISTNEVKSASDLQRAMVCAMAQHQLNRTQESQAMLGAGIAAAGRVQNTWLDGIIAHCLLREAKALIEGAKETRAGSN